ncbi:MAG: secondary thiamine-phosphate synthase enzyme YjbQ [Acidobacteria bacterium]|nr:secondary thiamine-phosphate synthase enzyme YjbQ [Acidobacteriota bacterium]
MRVKSDRITFDTRGNASVDNLTGPVAEAVRRSGLKDGTVTLFTPSATSALTTLEFEPGCVADLRSCLEEVAPSRRAWAHNERWGDGNGHSHLRAALLGASLSVPFRDGRLTLGTWQQIVFVDFDTRPRRREIVVQILGE